ncbi:MAG TPA: hypothetical protein VGG10_18235 [Rhizomicrobium sp.]|jgi:hypothetical protein
MGQNNDNREHGDRQGHQGGQPNKSNPQDQQRQQQKSGMPDENMGGSKHGDKTANKGSEGSHNQKR